jgi:PST family polysaccharide transporter
LLILGFAFMVSGVLSIGSTYAVGVFVSRYLGLTALGYYSAAYQLAFTYPAFILAAMGRDFYPRLTAASKDPVLSTRLVNEQLEVSVLLAAPGVVAVLALAPTVIRIFNGPAFLGAVPILQWQILGFFLQVMSWALGYILIARADSRVFLWTEVVSNVVYFGFVVVAARFFGVQGAGIGYFMLYSRHNILLCLTVLPLLFLVFVSVKLLPSPWGMIFGLVATGGLLAYSLRELTRLLGEPPQRVIMRVLRRLAPRRQRGSA